MGACLSCKNEQGSRHEKTYTTLSFRRKRKKLVSDLDSKEEDVAAFRQLGGRIAPRVSPHDRNLVDYQVRDIEGRYNDLRQRSKHQKQACEVVIISRETLLKDLDGYVAWLKERKKMVGSQLSLGHGVQNVQQQLHEHNIICKEIESKHTVLESVSRQRETLLSELSHPERESVDKQIQSVQKEHSQLHNNALTKQKLLSRSLELREEFYQSYEKITIWVVEKERIVGKIDTIRLYAVEVERQHEKYKTLLTEVTSMEGTLEEVVTQGRNLQTDCDEQGTSELETMLKELLERYQTMKTRLSEHVTTLRMSLTVRRKYESNIQRLELWLKEVELTITTEIRLDCTIELIEEQLKKYQSLLQKIAEYEVLSDEVTSQGQSFLGSLSEADKLTLQAQIKTLRDRHQRISNLAKQRVKTLEDTVYARGQLDDEISQCARILNSLQEDVRRLNKPLAIKAVEVQKMLAQCEKLQTQLNDYQPTIIALNQSKDSMAAKGQTTEASELSRLTMTFDQVMMQVEQSYARLENAVTIRQHYESLKTEFETCLKESQEQLDAVSELGIPTPTKFDRYKAVHTILEEQELQLATIMDKGQQIAIECNTTDQRTVADQNQSLKQKFDKLLRAVEKKTEELDKIMSDRRDFETEMDKTLEWLQSKNREIVVQVPLSMEADEVEVEIKKHKVVADEINSHLREVQTKIAQQRAHFEELDEIMPIEMTDRLEQYENDRAALQVHV
ncbi:nesprin-1-like [Lingula anatina]|uniref:Nesprin-1-like n=1 Tax=Lingula anatina TaxID=7574 RepID=A0A2R2MQE6_LINAN|nr:nesprin-1-like [Lingula anatina]|eukprot:XP_023932383.1 nesprin-1-like [Lingula anatina]